MPVETERLVLRVPQLADAEPFMGIFWDPEVVDQKQVTLRQPPGGLDLALRNTGEMLQQWERRGYGQWTVVEKASTDVVGCVGFYHPEIDWPGVDLGWLLRRASWGRGLATEAAAAALQWAWANTAIDHVISLIGPGDLRSQRIAIKIGERFERAAVDPANGEPVHIYGIHRQLP